MFGLGEEDEIAALDPVVINSPELLKALEDINGAVLKEVLIERVKSGITKRQQELLISVMLLSSF